MWPAEYSLQGHDGPIYRLQFLRGELLQDLIRLRCTAGTPLLENPQSLRDYCQSGDPAVANMPAPLHQPVSLQGRHRPADGGNAHPLSCSEFGDGDRSAEADSPILYALSLGKTDLLPTLPAAEWPLDIFEAAAVGQAARVRAQLDQDGEMARRRTSDGYTALHYAGFFNGDRATPEVLLDAAADVDAVAGNDTRVQPLHGALAGRNYQVARLLVRRGADANARQQGGFTPLMAVAQNGDEAEVQWLLSQGADPSAINQEGKTAASYAGEAGHGDLAERLRPQRGRAE